MRNRISVLKAEQEADGFWQDNEKALKVGKELKKLEGRIEKVKSFEKKFADINALLEISEISSLLQFSSAAQTSQSIFMTEDAIFSISFSACRM